jgi:osmotically inducible lipoprotein OsmB
MKTLILSAVLASAVLSGCAGIDTHDQRVLGGAVIGGVIGNAVGGGVVGTVGGAAVGGLIGNEVDRNAKARERDRAEYNRQQRYNDCTRYYSNYYCNNNAR